jgi:transposase
MLKRSMSREIQADYETQYLFPRSLEEWVGADDPARFIREFVRLLDLKDVRGEEEVAAARDSVGRPHYSFELLLSVWLYAYVYGLRGSREVERACRTMLPLVWLAGTHQPDHNTLWRFWNRHREKLHDIFVQSVKVAIKSGAVGMVLNAIDGTKILSKASKRGEWHRKDLEKVLAAAQVRLDKIEADIAAEGPGEEIDDRLPEVLQQQRALVEKIRESLEELDTEGQEHLQPQDREARMMVTSNGRTAFAYNAQAVVDQKNGIIVAAAVTDEANDQHQLLPMLEQVETTTGATAETTVGDSGYDTAEGLGGAAERQMNVVVASKIDLGSVPPYHTSRFQFDPERDQVQCPRAEWLDREGIKHHRNKPYALMTYRCHVTSCPVRNQCSRDRKGRIIEISPHHAAVVRNRRALTGPETKKLMRQRSAIVERVFAEIKETLGFRRWTVAGKEKVTAQWALICAAMNLRRMMAARITSA